MVWTLSKTCLQGPPTTSTFDWCFWHPWHPKLYSCTVWAIMSRGWPTSCDTSCISHRLITAHVHSTQERESRRLLCHYLFRLHLSHTSPKPSSFPASDLNSSLPPLSKLLYPSPSFCSFLALSRLLHLFGFLQCWTCNLIHKYHNSTCITSMKLSQCCYMRWHLHEVVFHKVFSRSLLPSQRKNFESPTLISPCVGVISTWMAAGEKEKKREENVHEKKGWHRGEARKGEAQNQIVLPAQKNNHFSGMPSMNETLGWNFHAQSSATSPCADGLRVRIFFTRR